MAEVALAVSVTTVPLLVMLRIVTTALAPEASAPIFTVTVPLEKAVVPCVEDDET